MPGQTCLQFVVGPLAGFFRLPRAENCLMVGLGLGKKFVERLRLAMPGPVHGSKFFVAKRAMINVSPKLIVPVSTTGNP
jgi:hypothetical protein